MPTYNTTGPYVRAAAGSDRQALAGVPAFRLRLQPKAGKLLEKLLEHNEQGRQVGKAEGEAIGKVLDGRAFNDARLTQAERDEIARLQREQSAAESRHAQQGMRLARAYTAELRGMDENKLRKAAAVETLRQHERAKQAMTDLKDALDQRERAWTYAGSPNQHKWAINSGSGSAHHWTSGLVTIENYVSKTLDVPATQDIIDRNGALPEDDDK